MHALPNSVPPTLQQATTNPRLSLRLLDTHRQVWVSLLWGHCSFLLGPGAQGSVCALQEYFPALCKFWQFYSGVNCDLLQEGLCHTQVCCTQIPCPFRSPLLILTSTGDTQTLKGRSGSLSVVSPAVHKVLFEPSDHLSWLWGLILNAISPL